VFKQFRTGFLGKSSPVHFFWGSFDLAVTRFSGRLAPLHPGGVPHLADDVAQEAYSHEVSSAGYWPGSGTDYDDEHHITYLRLLDAEADGANWQKLHRSFYISTRTMSPIERTAPGRHALHGRSG
jgi:hypothetical protein